MQRIEIGDAVDAEDNGLAIDDELLMPVPQRALDDPRITAAPVVAVPGNQAHAVAIASYLISWSQAGVAGTALPLVGRQGE